MNNEFQKKFAQKLEEALAKARQARMEEDRKALMGTIGQDLAKMLAPFLNQVAASARANKEDMREMMHEMMGQVSARDMNIDTTPIVDAIHNAMGGIQLPAPKVTVNAPEVRVPDFKMPERMPIEGFVGLMGVDLNNPLPVQIRDRKGNPIDFSGLNSMVVGGGGGFRRVKIDNTASEPIPISGTISATFSADFGSGEIASETLRTVQATDAISSVNVVGIFGTTTTSGFVNPDNRIRVSVETGGSGLTDAEIRATALPVSQVSGANWSVAVSDVFATTATSSVVNPDNRVKVELPSFTQPISVTDIFATTSTSNVVNPDNRVKVELPATSVTVSSVTASIAANVVDSGGIPYTTTNPLPINLVSQSLASSASALVDSGGVQYSGSNPVPVVLVANVASSTAVVGDTLHDAADAGAAPVKVGGVAVTTNPTAVSDGDRVNFRADDLGRQLMRPVNARDLILTARVAITNGSETTLRAAVAGAYLDLIQVVAANNSDAAVSLDIRAVTGGNAVLTLQVPANGTAGVACSVPIPQDETGNNWTIDMSDITGTTVTVTALFSREV